jgi:N-acyl homoserine lactone hydrolase
VPASAPAQRQLVTAVGVETYGRLLTPSKVAFFDNASALAETTSAGCVWGDLRCELASANPHSVSRRSPHSPRRDVTTIHAISTGLVQVRRAQTESRGKGIARMTNMLVDPEWTGWLPIYTWVIEHDEGVILVDTGETARVHEAEYHPQWHPFYRRGARFSVQPQEEIGPQLRALGINTRDVRQVVLTHLHTDHAGGLAHLTGSRVWVAGEEYNRATGLGGRVQGYLPHRWPKWWQPEFIRFDAQPFGAFDKSMSLTKRGDVLIVPTPGHTPNHVSVVVRSDVSYFLAGDTSYNQGLLLAGKIDGVSPKPQVAQQTHERILSLAAERPLVYLPSHDPEGARRLAEQAVIDPSAIAPSIAAPRRSAANTTTVRSVPRRAQGVA